MIVLGDAERALLARVLEDRLDVGRKGNPRLRPLSMYSSELKNMKQVAGAVERAAAGLPLADVENTAKRYANTLSNMGLWEGADRGVDIGPAGAALLQLGQGDDGTAEFWQQRSRRGDRLFFEHQVDRLVGGREGLVSPVWREVFLNAQELLDHLPEADVRAALADPDLREVEALQYMDAVGTEPWRYARLPLADRATVRDLMLRLRTEFDADQQAKGDALLGVALAYGSAASRAFQRDVRFRVAGFLEAFVDVRATMGARFPRLGPDKAPFVSPAAVAQGAAAGLAGGVHPQRPVLPLPLQVIVSGCPGSGKSALAERSAAGALVFRTQFHAETTAASFVGGFRPAPVYEPMDGLVEAGGGPFAPGRPLIDYRFVPGQALVAVAAAVADPARNVVLLVEELNRGNAAAIFGELFQLLDRAEDGWSRYGVAPSAEAAAWLAAHGALGSDGAMRFPPNLHLWATMNSGDQGVFPIDSAFRRRWSYRYLGYAEPCLYPAAGRAVRFGGRDLDWDLLRAALNSRLKKLQVGEDRLIGPYFLTPAQLRAPAEVLSKLLLYLWDDVLRFRQHEVFSADSFAGVTTAWKGGEGNPLVDGVVDLDAAAAPVIAGDGDDDDGAADLADDAGGGDLHVQSPAGSAGAGGTAD